METTGRAIVLLICILASLVTGAVTSSSRSQPLDFVILPAATTSSSSSVRCVTSLPDGGGSIWKIEDWSLFSGQGYFPISQLYSKRGCDQTPEVPLVVARSRARNIASPLSFSPDHRFNVNESIATVYKLICPHGYVSMGDVIHTVTSSSSSSSEEGPDVGDYRCVKEELTTEAYKISIKYKTREIQQQQQQNDSWKLRSVATSSGWNSGGFFSTARTMRVLRQKPAKFEQRPLFVLTDDVICVGVVSTVGSSDVHGSVWRPNAPPGGEYYVIGHVMVHGGCDVTPPSIVVARSSGDSLAAPEVTSSTTDPTWSTNYRIFTCPRGYVAMGAVAITDDVITDFRCVKKELTRIAQFGHNLLLSEETGAKVLAISDTESSSSWKSNFFFATRAFRPSHTYTLRNDPFGHDVINAAAPNKSLDEQRIITVVEENRNHRRNISVTVGNVVGSIGFLVSMVVVATVCYRKWKSSDAETRRSSSTKSDVTRATTPTSGVEEHAYACIDNEIIENEIYRPMTSSGYDHIFNHPPPLPPQRPPPSSSMSGRSSPVFV